MERKPPPDVTPRHLDWRVEITIAIRDRLACRRCEVPLVDDTDRSFVLIDPAGGDDLENLALVCPACRNAHAVHPEAIPGPDERVETIT